MPAIGKLSFRAIASVVWLLAAGSALAETYPSEHYELRVVTVARGLEYPWGLAFLPDGSMLVTERPGRLRLVGADGELSPPLAGVPTVRASGQGGLLDVALDPDFGTNETIYLSYAEPGNGGAGTAVARARLDGAGNRLTGLRVIFRQVPKTGGGRHFGSRLVFARDGRLFITVGERGERERAQDFTINRGQVIRIDRDGAIPTDNPFVGKKGYRPEVWSHGHRNPQGAALHPESGKLWVQEHGARGGDEVNIPLPGRNYGWPVIAYGRHYSGRRIGVGTRRRGLEQPVYYWDPSIAPSGMAFYTGEKFPKWRGSLFVGALKFRLVARLILRGEKVVGEERILQGLGERIRDVRQGPDGFIYLLTDAGDGRILRVEPAGG
ncbi:MAG: PQQ-dependent sugar dehydrogenase [Alphaproteobacteria bacterium]|jgi:glucose/arabinose dehydrogenase|nr:PQQ-dependent sugar dehydrogenase [Alphaproteobacteria bacterium]MDP6815337.1 PQQ-dependent sugar dehydrogenase [Alphaproteobacteria bacterium]